mgnify:CR=1 FL=1
MIFFRRNRCKVVYRSEYLSAIHAQNAHQSFDVMRFKKVKDWIALRKDELERERGKHETI